jgi:phage protein D
MHPTVVITIDGAPVAGVFYERLVSVTVNDREGTRSDSVQMTLEAGPPFLAIPRKKAIIRVWMGYGMAPVYRGAFTADDVELKCIPYKLEISGKAADMRSSSKEHKDKHWDKKTVKQIVTDLAKLMGVTAQVAAKFGSMKIEWFGMKGESPLHAVRRLAERVGALATVKDGKLLFVEKGKGQTAGGKALPELVIVPTMVKPDSLSVKWTEREKNKKVKATHHNRGKAKRETVETSGAGSGTGAYTLRHNHANKDEAKAAAEAKAKELERAATQTSVTIEGNPAAAGGGPMRYFGFHPSVDSERFVITNAAHTFSKGGGYTTAITAKKKV